MYNYSILKSMPAVLQAQDDALHQEQLDALDRYDFAEALLLSQQQRMLREKWYIQFIQEQASSSVTTKEVALRHDD
ncbi:hypothetical protein [Paenibacillus ihuae]|uniref:hypothetical protein n=1 Tax=Paenibacillus ihuae TaxID=1232431 RepID=UPI0006D57568|nr:hypothetical protein [Paenibacillus ihuae]